MSRMKNNVLLIGNLGADPEFAELTNGGKMLRFNLATNDSYRNKKGEWVDKTEWHRCVAWRAQAERMRDRLRKGVRVAIRGKLTYYDYQDKEGVQRRSSQVEVFEYTILDKAKLAS